MSRRELNAKHHLAASLLALGVSECETARRCTSHRNSVKKWRKKPEFQALIHEYTCVLANAVEKQAIDEVEFLADTVRQAMKDRAKRGDGIRAAELLLRMKGELDDQKVTGEVTINVISHTPRLADPEPNTKELETAQKQLEEGRDSS